ncbi:TetR/AcrR family transcriptional regulator [Pseudonocardia asaccharolytica]|nr:TetR/AcrR family transcriptional regulator [Pseudonocardia asaccharolytica]
MGDAHTRAARTKRDRTRRALLDSAAAAFSARGWLQTRVEDVAAAAGVSTATAYNHFPTKHALIGHVYAPLVGPVLAQAAIDLDQGRPVVDALIDHIGALTRVCWRYRALTAAFCAAAQDYTIRVGGPPRPDDEQDPRILVPLTSAIHGLVTYGQLAGALHAYPPATEISGFIINLLLIRSINRPHEPHEQAAELLLTMLFGALRPELLVAGGAAGRPFRRTG